MQVGKTDIQEALATWYEPAPAAHTASDEPEITESLTSVGSISSYGDRIVSRLLNTRGDQRSSRESEFKILLEPREQSD